MTIRGEVYKYFDSAKARKIIASKLVFHISKVMQREVSRDSVLRCARDYADISGATFECVDSQKSIYRFVPGYGIGKGILEGRE